MMKLNLESEFFKITKKDIMYGIILILFVIMVYFAGGINNMMLVESIKSSCPCVIDANSLTNSVVYNTSIPIIPIH